MRPRSQVVTLDVIGGEQLVEWRLSEPLSQFSHRTKDHAPVDTHHAPLAVLVLDRLPVQQVRIPPALGLLAGSPAFGLGRIWLHFSAVVLGQRLAIAPPVGNEEGRLTITDLFDLADEDVSRLSAVLADVRSQTQLGLRLQGPPDEVLSDGIKVQLVASDVLLLFSQRCIVHPPPHDPGGDHATGTLAKHRRVPQPASAKRQWYLSCAQ